MSKELLQDAAEAKRELEIWLHNEKYALDVSTIDTALKALKLTLFLLNHHNDTEELLILAERCEDGRQNMTVDELEKRLSD